MAEQGKRGIPFLDIGKHPLSKVKKHIRSIQRWRKWGDAYLIKSSTLTNWHVYFLNDFVHWDEIINVIDSCPIVDEKFKQFKDRFPYIKAKLTKLPNQRIIIIKSPYNGDNKNIVMENFLKTMVG